MTSWGELAERRKKQLGMSTMWETVYDEPYDKMDRLPVPGGWIYRNKVVIDSRAQVQSQWVWNISICYVAEQPIMVAQEPDTP
jgi:hypothetical protein